MTVWAEKAVQVVLIGGAAGSGKSELGRMLADATNWVLLDKDTLTLSVVEVALELGGLSPDDRESDIYRTKIRPAEYRDLMAAVQDNVLRGNSAIVVAPFTREFNDEEWLIATKSAYGVLGARITVVWVYAEPEVMRNRLLCRGTPRDGGKLSNWDTYLSTVDPDFRPLVSHRAVNNSGDYQSLVRHASNLLTEIVQ